MSVSRRPPLFSTIPMRLRSGIWLLRERNDGSRLGRLAPVRYFWWCTHFMNGIMKKSFASSRRAQRSHMKGRPMKKLTKEQKRDIRAIAGKEDADIDFSDVAPVLDWQGAEIGKFYRPKKQPVTMRLDSDVIAW